MAPAIAHRLLVQKSGGVRYSVHERVPLDTEPSQELVVKNGFYDEQFTFTLADRVYSGPDRLQSNDLDAENLLEVREHEMPKTVQKLTEENLLANSLMHRVENATLGHGANRLDSSGNEVSHELLDRASTGARPSPSLTSESSFGTWMPMEEGLTMKASSPEFGFTRSCPSKTMPSITISPQGTPSSSIETLLSRQTSSTSIPETALSPGTSAVSMNHCNDAVTCYMDPHSRHTRCRKQFVQSGSTIIDGRCVCLKLFVKPSSAKPRSKDLCFRSPHAGLKLELRADYVQDDCQDVTVPDLGCMDVIFSVEGDKGGAVQHVEHAHVFDRSTSPVCACPLVFDPPAPEKTWIVRVRLTPASDSLA